SAAPHPQKKPVAVQTKHQSIPYPLTPSDNNTCHTTHVPHALLSVPLDVFQSAATLFWLGKTMHLKSVHIRNLRALEEILNLTAASASSGRMQWVSSRPVTPSAPAA